MKSQKQLAHSRFCWEVFKAFATIIGAVAMISGTVIALENYLRVPRQQLMLPPGTVITIPPVKP